MITVNGIALDSSAKLDVCYADGYTVLSLFDKVDIACIDKIVSYGYLKVCSVDKGLLYDCELIDKGVNNSIIGRLISVERLDD